MKFLKSRTALLILLFTSSCLLTNHAANAQATKPGFSGQTAYTLAREYVTAAPHRWIGSPDHAKAEEFIKSHFKQEAAKGNFEVDSFSANTPVGYLPMKNFIVRYPGKKNGVIVIGSHYETNYWLKNINYVGANDGGSTTGLLIELGNYFRAHPPEGYSVWLVFFDGEESINTDWTDRDSLYGSRHLAAKWASDGTLSKVKAFLLADMIGDKDLNINLDDASTPWLREMLRTAAKNTGHSAYIYKHEIGVEDDHLPFAQRGVPVLDLIDMDYGPHTAQSPDGYHHTDKDTLDKISAHSLQVSGDLFLEMVRLINQK